jgi:molybdopterin-guanine dinucleotide biosynthesis protein A
VLDALRWAGDRPEVMVLACDLPFVTGDDLGPLARAAVDHPHAAVIVSRTDRREPACAVWRTDARDRLAAILAGGERAVHRALDRLDVVEAAVEPRALRNINTPDDLPGYP